jgi:hypothetical protein
MVAQTDLDSPVDLPEIKRAVETLYCDKIKPYGRLLMIRLTEHAEECGRPTPEVKEQRIRSLCDASLQLAVQNEKGGEWSVLLRGRPDIFVDFHSPEDMYPPELWEAFVKHFENPEEAEKDLPRARYLCAKALEEKQLPFLVNRPLGELMHIVQLAISVKKILGYQKDAIVPYGRSKNKLKEQSAAAQQHHASDVPSGEKDMSANFANWPQARSTLQKVMRRQLMNSPSHPIPLSRVKQLFETESGLKLSETALGHAKLSDLLNDPRLADILTVQLQSRVYMVCPVVTPDRTLALDDLIGGGCGSATPSPHPMGMPPMGMWPPPMPGMHMPMPPPHLGIPPMVPPHLGGLGMPPMYNPALDMAMRKQATLDTVYSDTASNTSTQDSSPQELVGRTPTGTTPLAKQVEELEVRPVLTKHGLESRGFKVKNTFIEPDLDDMDLTSPGGLMMTHSYTEPNRPMVPMNSIPESG